MAITKIGAGFFVEGKFFSLKQLGTSFVVKSTPYNYKVNFTASKNPFRAVNQWFQNKPDSLLLIDQKVFSLYKNFLEAPKSQIFRVDADENFKTFEGTVKLIDFLQLRNFTKADSLLVVGGGVVQDVAALVGALYKRGIPWVFFPTTLLAMCDSCIGAKASINYRRVKNQLGLFCAPKKIFINVNFLKSLDSKQLKSGLGEIFKLCVSGGQAAYRAFVARVQNGQVRELKDYQELIKLSLGVKKLVIEADEFDQNLRRSLNYGHTFGHALEAMTEYAIPHGQAVVAGMLIVNEFSEQKGWLNKQSNQQLRSQSWSLLDENSRKALKQADAVQLLGLLKRDKKILGKTLNLVLLKAIGRLAFYPVSLDEVFLSKIKSIIKKLFN